MPRVIRRGWKGGCIGSSSLQPWRCASSLSLSYSLFLSLLVCSVSSTLPHSHHNTSLRYIASQDILGISKRIRGCTLRPANFAVSEGYSQRPEEDETSAYILGSILRCWRMSLETPPKKMALIIYCIYYIYLWNIYLYECKDKIIFKSHILNENLIILTT